MRRHNEICLATCSCGDPPRYAEHTVPAHLSEVDQATIRKMNGCPPLGPTRLKIRWQETIPKICRTETQTFVILNSFYLFPLGARICADRPSRKAVWCRLEGFGLSFRRRLACGYVRARRTTTGPLPDTPNRYTGACRTVLPEPDTDFQPGQAAWQNTRPME